MIYILFHFKKYKLSLKNKKMSSLIDLLDIYETIDLQNSKSQEILNEYERIAEEKRTLYKNEEDQLLNENKLL